MYGHHSSTDRELAVVPSCSCHHVTQFEDVAHPSVRIGEVVDTNLAGHVVPVVPEENKLHISRGKLLQIRFLKEPL